MRKVTNLSIGMKEILRVYFIQSLNNSLLNDVLVQS